MKRKNKESVKEKILREWNNNAIEHINKLVDEYKNENK